MFDYTQATNSQLANLYETLDNLYHLNPSKNVACIVYRDYAEDDIEQDAVNEMAMSKLTVAFESAGLPYDVDESYDSVQFNVPLYVTGTNDWSPSFALAAMVVSSFETSTSEVEEASYQRISELNEGIINDAIMYLGLEEEDMADEIAFHASFVAMQRCTTSPGKYRFIQDEEARSIVAETAAKLI